MDAINIRCEYLDNPCGIDITHPLIRWNCINGVRQTAFEIMFYDEDMNMIHDTGKLYDNHMSYRYPLELKSRDLIFYKIRLWDENDVSDNFSELHSFEMGLLNRDDWKAKWITGDYRVNKKVRYPVGYFKKEISLKGEVKKARLYITACGVYEARINNKRVGSFVLAPGHTDYKKRVQYQTYDVKDLLNENNIIDVMLGDGWYRGSIGAWGLRNQYGTETRFIAQLEIEYLDGTKESVLSDETWQFADDGPIRFADNKDGERVDGRLVPHFNKKVKITSHNAMLSASNNNFIEENEVFLGCVYNSFDNKVTYDFGQNIAGYVEFRVNAKDGDRIIITCGEMLDENDRLTLKNIQCATKDHKTPLQKIEYICHEGLNIYKPSFTIFGFRYCEVESDVCLEEIKAISLYTKMRRTGTFTSSNKYLDKFVEATVWSAKGNSGDVPTDCPTRERHGWSGDAQIFFNSAAYLLDYAAFARKYVKDLYDFQKSDGMLPQIAPYGGVDFYMYTLNGSIGWADAGILIPYRFWKMYDDDSLIKEYYEGMKKYALFMIKRCGKFTLLRKRVRISKENQKYLVNYGQSYGEWAEPKDVYPNDWKDMVFPHVEESTAYTSFVMKHMMEIALYLNKNEDYKLYEKYCEGTKRAYQELVHIDVHKLDTDRQAKLVRPLYMHLLNPEDENYAKRRLIQALDNYGWRLGTGFLSTPLILDVLKDIDYEYAFRLLENEEMPGWLFMPKNNATTIWESWEGTKAQGGIASLNHYSKGAMCEWLFREMAGIEILGDNKIMIKPHIGGHFTEFSSSYDSVYGRIVISVKKENGNINYHLEIPGNTVAIIDIKGIESMTVNSGIYNYSVKEE